MIRPVALFLTAAALVTALPGCSRIRDSKGYVADEQLIGALQTGVDNRASVQKTLGRPTLVSEVDPNTWFYVSQTTRQLAFLKPKPNAHQVLVVNFDAKGNLAQVRKLGLNDIVNVSPSGDKTPTLGKETSFWQELFGDVGKFGPAGGGAGGDGGGPP